jgi:hypothetical protein
MRDDHQGEPADRDDFHASLRRRLQPDACRDNCASQLTAIEQGEKAKLAEIEAKSALAKVR